MIDQSARRPSQTGVDTAEATLCAAAEANPGLQLGYLVVNHCFGKPKYCRPTPTFWYANRSAGAHALKLGLCNMLLRLLSGRAPRNPTYNCVFQISRRIGLTYAQHALNPTRGLALRNQGSYFLKDIEIVLHYPTLRRSTLPERKSTILELQLKPT